MNGEPLLPPKQSLATEVAAPGSHLYYSLLFCDDNHREKMMAMRGLDQKLSQLSLKSTVHEKEILAMQFDYWKKELQTSRPSHPLVILLNKHNLMCPEWLDLVSAYEKDAAVSLYETSNDIQNFFCHTGGLLEKLIFSKVGQLNNINNINDIQMSESFESLGCFIKKADFLIHFRKYRDAGKIYFSGEQLLKHHVTLYDLSMLKQNQAVQNLFSELLHTLESEYYQVVNNSLQIDSEVSRASVLLAKLYLSQLKMIEKNILSVLTHKTDMTPIRKLWKVYCEKWSGR